MAAQESRDHIGIYSLTRLAENTAGDRAAHEVLHAQFFKAGDDSGKRLKQFRAPFIHGPAMGHRLWQPIAGRAKGRRADGGAALWKLPGGARAIPSKQVLARCGLH